MTAERFIDTNVLVYAYDSGEPVKQARAQKILVEGLRDETTALSAQVLGEFFVVVTRCIQNPMTAADARQVISALSRMPVQDIDRLLVADAIDIHQAAGISYWDALIIAAARRIGCGSVLTEDLNHGQTIEGIRIENPFL